jgi:tRNA 2-thiouridine synthesizing protein C
MSARESAARRSVLVVCRTAPYGRSRARDAVDVAMAFAAFDQPVTLLFLGDGVLALAAGQRPAPEFSRSLEKILGTLADYGVEDIHADAAALAARGLEPQVLALPVRLAGPRELRELFAAHERVLTV